MKIIPCNFSLRRGGLGVVGLLLTACSSPPDQPRRAAGDAAPPTPPAGVTFITLGTGGGPVIRLQRAEPANAVLVDSVYYLFDAGANTIRQLKAARLPLKQLRAVFISHHHVDHNAGLAPVLLNRWLLSPQPPPALPIIGPPGTEELVRGLAAAYRPAYLAPLTNDGAPKPTIASTLAPRDLAATLDAPQVVYQDERIRVLAVTNTHYHFPPGSPNQRFSRSYSYRIETPQRVVVFTGDTGPSAHVEALAKGADLLVSEVLDLPATARMISQGGARTDTAAAMDHMRRDHLTPTQVGQLAARAGVKAVVLTHLVPGNDGETDLGGYTRGLATHYHGPVRVARDLGRY